MGIIGFLQIGLCMLLLNACQSNLPKDNNAADTDTSSIGIDLENRTPYALPSELDEISGHTFLPTIDDVVYCVQDENGIVFAYDLNKQCISHRLTFGDNGDYEGITNDGRNFYILRSDGTIYSFPIGKEAKVNNNKVFKKLLGKGEYESLGIDTIKRQLAVLCKSCKVDKGSRQSTGYLLDYSQDGDIKLSTTFTIDLDDIAKLMPRFPKTFNPSAITKKVSTNEWYILSSIDKVLLIADSTFKPVAVIPFSRKLYEQPEGLAFDSKGNLYISSEKRDHSSAMLYKIN